MAGLGFGAMIQGASRGLDDVENRALKREDQDYERTRRTNEQTDRTRRLSREDITQGREDTEYAKAQKDDARRRDIQEAVRTWQMSGDPSVLAAASNKYTPDGVKHWISKNEDGTYDAVGEINGVVKKRTISEDEVGQFMMTLAVADPAALFSQQLADKKATAAKEADYAHDIRLERVKGEEDRKSDKRTPARAAALDKWYQERYDDIDDKEAAQEYDPATANLMRQRVDERYQEAMQRVDGGGVGAGGDAGGAAPATPKTQAEYDALKPGDLFVDPEDGKTYKKPAADATAAPKPDAAAPATTDKGKKLARDDKTSDKPKAGEAPKADADKPLVREVEDPTEIINKAIEKKTAEKAAKKEKLVRQEADTKDTVKIQSLLRGKEMPKDIESAKSLIAELSKLKKTAAGQAYKPTIDRRIKAIANHIAEQETGK